MARNPIHHRRTKHIELYVHFVREKVALGELRVLQIPSARQFVDIFTKGLPSSLFNDFRDSLCIGKPTTTTEGGVSGLVCTGPACKLVCNRWTRLTRSDGCGHHAIRNTRQRHVCTRSAAGSRSSFVGESVEPRLTCACICCTPEINTKCG